MLFEEDFVKRPSFQFYPADWLGNANLTGARDFGWGKAVEKRNALNGNN